MNRQNSVRKVPSRSFLAGIRHFGQRAEDEPSSQIIAILRRSHRPAIGRVGRNHRSHETTLALDAAVRPTNGT